MSPIPRPSNELEGLGGVWAVIEDAQLQLEVHSLFDKRGHILIEV